MKGRVWTAVLCLLLLAGCGTGPKTGEKFEGEVNTFEGVTMTVVEGTAKPGTVTIEIVNATDRDIESGNKADFALQKEVDTLLHRYHDQGKSPSPIAKGMSHMKSTLKLGMEETDAAVADLMTDGCNMGVKSLRRYLNQYKAADETSKDIAKRLIHLEEKLTIDLRPYL